MAGNKKRGYSQRRIKDPVIGDPRPVRLRKSIHDNIDSILGENSFSGYVNGLIEDKYNFQSLYGKNVSTALGYADLTSVIGNGIDMADTFMCLHGWLTGGSISEIKIAPKSAALYKNMMDDLEQEEDRNYFFEEGKKAANEIREQYFALRQIHLITYNLFITSLGREDETQQKHQAGVALINSLMGMEFAGIFSLVKMSPPLRFAVYVCRQNHFFRERAKRPLWFEAVEQLLDKLDQEWVDPQGPYARP